MAKKYKRGKYFIHPPIQLKYIACSIVPVLIMSLFCAYLWIQKKEFIVRVVQEEPLERMSTIRQTIDTLANEGYTKNTPETLRTLQHECDSLQKILEAAYVETPQQWYGLIRGTIIALFAVLLSTAILALLYSHRIVGSVFRIRKYVDMLAEGQDISSIRLRKYDEFKELAESLDKLRMNFRDRGLLKSKDDN